ncbi:MAG: molybdopterin cofactor-binding domain-containing protein [Saprospiraceae bacterium]
MSKINTQFKRRTFLKTSAAAGGGVLIGFSWLASCKQERAYNYAQLPSPDMPEQWANLTGYIKIGENGTISIVNPNPEIGQNVKTSMPMIVAEELDCDWDQVIVEQAPLDTEKYKRQVAGGSQSIRHDWELLRKTGATAKAMLVTAAAKRWEVEASTLTVAKGIITNAKGETLGYGDVAANIVDMPVPEEISLKDPKDFKIIGHSKTNVDMKGILTGQPLFGIDTREKGMVYASMIRPPAFGQKLVSFEAEKAKAVNGVSDVIQIGDKIAIIASSNWPAMKAKKLINATWEEDTALESTTDHNTAMNKLMEKGADEPRRKDGDVEKAFADADEILERVYEAPYLPHNCLEPMNFYADVTEERIYTKGPIQTPEWTQSRIAGVTGRDKKDVTIDMTRMGGGFGRRLYGEFAEESALISQAINKPVQLLFTREDDMTAGTYRPASKYKIAASIKDGKVTGYKLTESAMSSNMYGLIPNFFPAGAIPNYKVESVKTDSNITTGAWRAPFTNFLGFAEQSFFDELADLMKTDAVELRLALLENAKGAAAADESIQYSPERMQETIKLAAEKGGWGKEESGVSKGFSAYYSHNTHVAEVAHVVMKDGSPVVKKVICAVDCGIVVNPEAAKNQVEGGVVDGVGHAMYGDLSFDKGVPSAANFDKYRLIRHSEAPEVEVHFVENGLSPTGLGEPSLPPAGGAVANALFKATGKRLYKQPFINQNEILG